MDKELLRGIMVRLIPDNGNKVKNVAKVDGPHLTAVNIKVNGYITNSMARENIRIKLVYLKDILSTL